jgi:hypothetical protein
MDSRIIILDKVEEVIKKHAEVPNPNYEKIVHNISVELDQMELIHDIAKHPKKGYITARVAVGGRVPYYILVPQDAQQKLFYNLLKQEATC